MAMDGYQLKAIISEVIQASLLKQAEPEFDPNATTQQKEQARESYRKLAGAVAEAVPYIIQHIQQNAVIISWTSFTPPLDTPYYGYSLNTMGGGLLNNDPAVFSPVVGTVITSGYIR